MKLNSSLCNSYRKYLFFLFIFSSVIISQHIIAQNIETFPLPSCYQVNENYTLQVKSVNADQWIDVPLINHTTRGSLNCTYGNFRFTDPVEIRITKNSRIASYSIKPISYQLEGNLTENILSLTLTDSRYLMITIDGTDIIVLADEINDSKPDPSGDGIFNITASPYNADKTGATIVTNTIQQAIDDASAYAGGTGIVYIPAGVYSITRLNAKSNIEIYLEGGAVLRGTGNPQDYNEYVPGGNIDYTYCIYAENQNNIKIWGPGTIDGNGIKLTGLTASSTQPADIENATMKIRALSIHNCSNIEISNIITRECSSWTQSFYDSDNISVNATKVINERVLKHNDGIDFSACQHVRAEHCFVLTSDDALCAKGTNDNGEDCYDITFEDIVVYSNTRGVKCGMQAYNQMYDIWFRNIDVLNARYGIDLLHQDGTGEWHDIHFIDIRVEDLNYFTPSQPRPIVASVQEGGPVKNVEITNCSFNTWGSNNSRLVGHKYGSISNIVFTNLKIADELMYSAEQANMDLNVFTVNIIFQVGEYDEITFPSKDDLDEEYFIFEPEDFSGQELFAPFVVREDENACGGKYIESDESSSSLAANGKVIYNFTIQKQDDFMVWMRTIAPNDTDDSFWVVMDGTPHKFNNIEPSTSWKWDIVKDSDSGENPIIFNLAQGDHTLEIVRRENGAKLDKVYITNQTINTPDGCIDALSTGNTQLINMEDCHPQIVVQNPVHGYLELHNDLVFPAKLRIFDLKGRLIDSLDLTEASKVNVSGYKRGIYLLELTNEEGISNQKVLIN